MGHDPESPADSGHVPSPDASVMSRGELVLEVPVGQAQALVEMRIGQLGKLLRAQVGGANAGTGVSEMAEFWLEAFGRSEKLEARGQKPEVAGRPRVVCLCGSTRFTTEMACLAWALERDEGYIVLGWHLLPADHPDLAGTDGTHGAEAVGRKEHFDELHRRKIDLADKVLVLNLGGYIGESTRGEIEYAKAQGKPVVFMEEEK